MGCSKDGQGPNHFQVFKAVVKSLWTFDFWFIFMRPSNCAGSLGFSREKNGYRSSVPHYTSGIWLNFFYVFYTFTLHFTNFFHWFLQLLALANGDRVKDKQRSRNSFIVDMDKKLAAEYLLKELSSYHGALIRQVFHKT